MSSIHQLEPYWVKQEGIALRKSISIRTFGGGLFYLNVEGKKKKSEKM